MWWQLRLQQNDASAQKLELESFFMHCCEEVKRDIQMKKSRSVSREGGLATGTLPEEISLQDFLRTDKRHLLELVLANNEVLAQLHECLFRCHAGRGSEPRHSSEEAEKAT
ncbi:myosin heavy chain [Cystoisospora suis]|uniref:Myosin heavy chain n=1 Tax=Cystoisospora suis TaxID=483139 RepID=A0A2C6JYB8_9APIC|nr:myosin heavy chain [Cystoisospora suis]